MAVVVLPVPAALRRCPLCGADAIAAVACTESGRRVRCEVRCGVCETWRAVEVGRRRAAAFERRLRAIVRRDCRRMALACAHGAPPAQLARLVEAPDAHR